MTPPRLPRWLLEHALSPEAAEAIIGDLTEGFLARAAAAPAAARLWFWRQSLTSIGAAYTARLGARRDSASARRRGRVLGDAQQDVRFAIRSLRRAPVFTITAVATLAIGIGASAAIGTAANETLLRPLPYPHGNRLVFLGHPNDDGTVGNVGFTTVVDWRARITSFDELSIVRGWTPTLTSPEGASSLNGMRVNWNYFRMLGVRPALGRDFEAGDDDPTHWRVVIISDALWKRQFQGRPDIIGTTIDFFSRPYQVIGVMPASYEPAVSEHFVGRADLWAPLGYDLAGDSSCRSCRHLRLLGRLREGVTLQPALTQAATVHADLRRQYPSDYTAAPPVGLMLQDEIGRTMRRPLQVLLGAVLFVLLVAATNVAGLLLSRAADRDREFALRAALGAGRGRLIRQLITEAAVLALLSATLGVLLARAGLSALARFAPPGLPRLDPASANSTLLVVALLVAAGALAAFGVMPALWAARHNLESTLRTTRHSASSRSLRIREWLIGGQVAVALLLIAGAGLMHRTVDRLLHVDPGFDARGVLTADFSLVGPAWAEDKAVLAFQDDLVQRVRALPGVEHAALAGQVPLGGNYDRRGLHIEGRTYPTAADAPEGERYSVTPDYFAVMRIPLEQGRLFTEADTLSTPRVMLINETMARTMWPGENPVGARVHVGGPTDPLWTIVGVVGDVRHYALGEPPTPQVYLPQRQFTDSFLVLVMRTSGEPGALAAPVRRLVTSMATDVPITSITTLEENLGRSVASRTFLMGLLGLFAVATLVMAAVGLYGIVSQGVGARHREFGVRLALGAARRDITWLAARRGFWFVAGGVVAGLASATVTGRFLSGQLYETQPADPIVLAGASAVLLIVAAMAHVGPVRRALGVDPAVTLRTE